MTSYVNIGAYDEGTMVDLGDSSGSCAQIGKTFI
jgi:tetrahydrodipicolinate N-succinyltransferase